MIPVKIAASLNATGIEGVRWVLVDDAEGGRQAPEPATPAIAAVAPRSRRRALLWLLKLVLIGAGLALAWMTTRAFDLVPSDHAVSQPPSTAAAKSSR